MSPHAQAVGDVYWLSHAGCVAPEYYGGAWLGDGGMLSSCSMHTSAAWRLQSAVAIICMHPNAQPIAAGVGHGPIPGGHPASAAATPACAWPPSSFAAFKHIQPCSLSSPAWWAEGGCFLLLAYDTCACLWRTFVSMHAFHSHMCTLAIPHRLPPQEKHRGQHAHPPPAEQFHPAPWQ